MEPVLDLTKVNRLIKRKYKTQAGLARHLGVSRQYVSHLLKKETAPSLERTILLADALGVSVNDLLDKGAKRNARAVIQRRRRELVEPAGAHE